MNYFSDLNLHHYQHLPACDTWIDQRFHGRHALNFCAAGEIGWQEEGKPLVYLKAPLLWWSWPGPHFRYGCRDGRPWDHYYITFSGPRVRRWVRTGFFPKQAQPFAPVREPGPYRERWEELLATLDRDGPAAPKAAHLLEGLLFALHEPAPAPSLLPHQQRLEHLARAIRTAPQRTWDFQAEAKRLGLSYSHFRRHFRAHTGTPPHQFLLRARLGTAADRLRNTAQPIKTVAESVGIADVYHFGKLFRACYHLPPGLYRREARQYSAATPPTG